jgi:hypothetical protein
MAAPLRALLVGPTASTTEFEDDVDGGHPGGCCRRVRQRPPPSLMTTGLDPILCPNILQNRAWKAVIIPMGLVPQATDHRYA